MPTERVAYRKNRFLLSGIGTGVAAGLVLVLVVLVLQALYRPPVDTVWPVLMAAIAIYFPTGYVTARRLMRVRQSARARLRLAPPAAHALVAGGLLALLHGLLLLVVNVGIAPGLQWFITEGALATVIAGTGGLFAARNDSPK